MEVRDPKGELRILSSLRPLGPSAFQCFQDVEYKKTQNQCRIFCDTPPCETRCESTQESQVQLVAEECESDVIQIYGSNGLIIPIEKSQYGRQGDHWIFEFLQQADFFIQPNGILEVDFVSARWGHLVTEDGDEMAVSTFEISLTYFPYDGAFGSGFLLIVSMDHRGLEQLLYFGEGRRGNYFLKKRNFLL